MMISFAWWFFWYTLSPLTGCSPKKFELAIQIQTYGLWWTSLGKENGNQSRLVLKEGRWTHKTSYTMMVQWPSVDTLKEPHSVLSLLFLERARTWMGSGGRGQGCCAVLSWGSPAWLPYLTILQVGVSPMRTFRCWAQLWCKPSVFILIWMASSRQNATGNVYILTNMRDAKLLKSLIFRKLMQEPGSTLYIATHKILFLYFLSNMVNNLAPILFD